MLVKDGKSRAKGRLQRPAARMGQAIEDAISSRDPVVATVARVTEWAVTGRIQCDIGAMENVEVTCRSLENILVGHHILIRKMGKGPTQRWVFAGWLGTGAGDDIVPEARLGSIPAHATTHQDGGSDEVSVEGLSGDLADAQDPKAHGTSHQDGGSDEINVAGLSGELADPQPPKSHASSHQDGGADEISVAGLSGDLADAQDPKTHASSHQNGGADEISVAGLSGALADEQDAGKIKGVDVIDTAIGDGKVLVYRTASGDLVYEAQAGGGGADEKVKVSSDDTTADYLINKLTAQGPITLTEVSPAGDEDLRIGYARGNIKWVTKSGGDYSTVAAALAAITTAAADNRYAIIVGPDVGEETVTLKSYVDLVGLGVYSTAANSVPIGLSVTGAPTDVGIYNILLTDWDGYAVNLTGGNVDFHHCRVLQLFDLNLHTVRVTSGTHRFFDCTTELAAYSTPAAIYASGGTVELHGGIVKATRSSGASAGPHGVYTAGGTVRLFGGVWITADYGSALYNSSGTIEVYAASYDPTDVSGTITGADKDVVIGELTVLKVPRAKAYLTANETIANNTLTDVPWDAEEYDTDNMWAAGSPTKLTCNTAGAYIVIASVPWDRHAGSAGRMRALITKNDASTLATSETYDDERVQYCVVTQAGLAVNDYIELQVLQNSGGNVDLVAASGTSLEAVRVA